MTDAGNGADGRTRTIAVDALARVEGEGAMRVTIRDGRVTDVALRIYEPPRFFEGLLRGRGYTEAPDITARICGICPVAYQMSAVMAMEDACGVAVTEPIQDLRRLLYCGEWIESHALHVYMLHAPDFMGYHGAIEMARDHREVVERGLRVKKAGNDILRAVGGRSVHPINVRVGGFHRSPTRAELAPVREDLLRAREESLETLRWTGTLDFPELEREVTLVSLLPQESGDYPIERGRIVSTGGLDIQLAQFNDHFVEEHVPHSTALHAALRDGGRYLVGPMARFALAFDRLPQEIRDEVLATGTGPGTLNPFRSIVVRSAEILYACDEALRLIDGYEPDEPFVEVPPRAGVGHGATEAPRGMLYQRYEIDEQGSIVHAQITPPTAQNQPAIEDDMTLVVADRLDLDDDALRHVCEQAIRNYDPCISCSTHFLDLQVDRG